MHPRTWKALLKLKEQTTGNNKPLLSESAGSPTGGIQRSLYGVPVYLTSQLSITETQGTSNDCSSAYVMQASEVVAVRRAEARIEVDSSRLFNQDMSEIRGILRFDLVVPNPKAVARIVGIKP
jgi:HK97 family phage major capsid protein